MCIFNDCLSKKQLFSYYVYVFITCRAILFPDIRVCIYLIVYHILMFMLFWSLYKTYLTPVCRVPDKYYVSFLY